MSKSKGTGSGGQGTDRNRRAGNGSREETPANPLQGGFWKLIVVAVVLVGLSAGLWFMTPWSKPGHTHMQVEEGYGSAGLVVSGPDEQGFVTTADGRRIRVNVGLPEQTVWIERDGQQIARFTVEVADTDQAQQIGLMGRDFLAPNRGMLFTWDPPSIIAMWMKDTLIPLDFLYIRPGGLIVGIAHEVPACPPETVRCPAYSAPEPVAHVVEIAAGRAKELGLKPGDLLVFGDMMN